MKQLIATLISWAGVAALMVWVWVVLAGGTGVDFVALWIDFESMIIDLFV